MQRTKCTMALVLVGAAAPLLGCGKPAFPSELFTVRADEADYPVMLSHAPAAKRKGRPVTVQSGTAASFSQSSYTVGNTQVTVTRTTADRSEVPASEQLAAKMRRTDAWMQLDSATFSATDFATYGASNNERLLIINATVVK